MQATALRLSSADAGLTVTWGFLLLTLCFRVCEVLHAGGWPTSRIYPAAAPEDHAREFDPELGVVLPVVPAKLRADPGPDQHHFAAAQEPCHAQSEHPCTSGTSVEAQTVDCVGGEAAAESEAGYPVTTIRLASSCIPHNLDESDDDTCSTHSVLSIDSDSPYPHWTLWDQSLDAWVDAERHLQGQWYDGVWRMVDMDRIPSGFQVAPHAKTMVIRGNTVKLGAQLIPLELQLHGGHVMLDGGRLVRVGDRLLRVGKHRERTIYKRLF
eukprot:TRINITY_DN31338_c0_g1_i1.p1 TRINITY_DN31338_c0_g1~~TRINITY_DN31338_c0_g1_i1.p1  ORF type:complete len:312 (+),score=27.15 TRINITY_DN31338_c0_g1_i1:133-936(+)